ncbi:uncharacterized protein LOC114785224 [Denticeps clupeoides]|uniref:uncharacterized protein LOC114785224 n=1 Tax=Denticeps clupeoides TaxID=299321 RepID=UPI0010A2C10C|nr:uncharacterized protein LOC114785224 [Denticeps clupeoides]
MKPEQRIEIAKVLLSHLIEFLSQFKSPACRNNIKDDSDWLKVNLGPFADKVDYSELKELNITGLAVLGSLSPEQKVNLLLDSTTGALENVSVVTEVFSSILQSPEQMDKFFEYFVQATNEANITTINNTAVRDTMLNLTLTALAPRFATFETSDFELWFQVNLFVLLASLQPASLSVIPLNISCDSFTAIIKGLDKVLAILPEEGLVSCRHDLVQELPSGCMVPIDIGSLEGKSPTEVAELTLNSGALNDTNQIETVFQFLENGDAFQNVDEFLTAVTNSSELPAISIAVRDIVMNLTFNIISTHFPTFDTADWEAWFKEKLVLVLPSFTAKMLTRTISNIGCTNYRVV